MTKEELIELAEDFLNDDEEPDWEIDLNDLVASVYADITTEGKCLVVFLTRNEGEIEDAKMFDTEEAAESFLYSLQEETYDEEEVDA